MAARVLAAAAPEAGEPFKLRPEDVEETPGTAP